MKKTRKKVKKPFVKVVKKSARIFIAGIAIGIMGTSLAIDASYAVAKAVKTGYQVDIYNNSISDTTKEEKTADRVGFGADLEGICDLNSVVCEYEQARFDKTALGTTYNAEVAQTDSDPFTMANGKRVNEGAVASNCYPLGTQVEVDGMGIFTVEDRMNTRFAPLCGSDKERIDFFKWERKDNFAKQIKFRVL